MRRAALLILLVLVSGARGQILSIHPPEDPVLSLLGRERGAFVSLESWNPWGMAGAGVGELSARVEQGPLDLSARLGWQTWETLQVQTADFHAMVPLSGLKAGLRLRAEFLDGRLFHALDALIAMRGRVGLALRFRLDEQTESGLAARSATEAMGLSLVWRSIRATWMRGGSSQRPVEDVLRLGWRRESWTGAWTRGPGPVQDLELGWEGRRRFAALRLRWHPWLGFGRGLVFGVRL